jgi:hypothetical protein
MMHLVTGCILPSRPSRAIFAAMGADSYSYQSRLRGKFFLEGIS